MKVSDSIIKFNKVGNFSRVEEKTMHEGGVQGQASFPYDSLTA